MVELSAGSALGPTTTGATIRVKVRYFAAARAAAGTTEELLDMPCLPTGCTVSEVLDAATRLHGPRLASVLLRCSFLLDERAVHGRQTPVRDDQVLDVLPPFAGG